MQTRQRWIASIAMGLLLGATGCDSGSDKGAGDGDGKADAGGGGVNGGGNDPANNGGGDDAGGGTGTEEDAGDDGPPPDLNYIPANEGKCDVDTSADLRAVAKQTLTDIAGYKAFKATELELCQTTASDRECAPCASNKFLEWVNAVDAADPGGAVGKETRMALADYFRRALQFPFRDLIVLDAPGESNGIILAQGKATCPPPANENERAECSDFTLQPESMEEDCVAITQNLTIDSTTTVGDVTTVVSKENSNSFGFIVPLTPTLPTYPLVNPTTANDAVPNACPTAVQVTNDEEFQNFLECNPSLTVQVTTPKVTMVDDADGANCMELTGLIDVTTLPTAARNLVDTLNYEDLDATGFIRINLAARLREATVTVEPSLTEEVAP